MKRSVRTLLIAGVAALALTACASTVGGTAEVGPQPLSTSSSVPTLPDTSTSSPTSSSTSESTSPSTATSDSRTSTATSTSTTSSETPTPTSTSTTRSTPTTRTTATTRSSRVTTSATKPVSKATKPNCSGSAIKATGNMFCYPIPKGFSDISDRATYPGTDPVKTAIEYQTSPRDLIFVTGITLSVDADTLSATLIEQSLETAFKSIGSTVKSTSPITQSTIAGDRAFETLVTFTSGSAKRYILIFAGHTRVSVSCQWQDEKAAIAAGCKSVLAGLQIAFP